MTGIDDDASVICRSRAQTLGGMLFWFAAVLVFDLADRPIVEREPGGRRLLAGLLNPIAAAGAGDHAPGIYRLGTLVVRMEPAGPGDGGAGRWGWGGVP
jgi:hypothetical protein